VLQDEFQLDGPSNRILDYINDFSIKANANCSSVVAQLLVTQSLHAVKADVEG